jgi:hypothetical protein
VTENGGALSGTQTALKLVAEVAAAGAVIGGVAKAFEAPGPLRVSEWLVLLSVAGLLAFGFLLGRDSARRRGAPAGVAPAGAGSAQEPDPAVESVRWYDYGSAATTVGGLLEKARSRVVLVGISNSAPHTEALKTFVKKLDTQLHVYLPAPACEGLGLRALDEGETAEQFRQEVEVALGRLRTLRRPGVGLHLYDWYPAWRIALIDDTAFVNTYPRDGRRGNEVDVMRIDEQTSPRLFGQVLDLVYAYQRSAADVPEHAPASAASVPAPRGAD